jgi:hypothetical protein
VNAVPSASATAKLADQLTALQGAVDDIEQQIGGLRLEYERAGRSLSSRVNDDVVHIHEAWLEVERITNVLRGTELFGRYAEDADHHLRIADRWRRAAVAILLLAPCVAASLALVAKLELATNALAMSFIAALFAYMSIESHNHRRREFDRRRIALRVSAIESFTKQRRDGGELEARKTAEDLLDLFVRRHFIEPELDSNDIAHLTPRTGLLRAKERTILNQHDVGSGAVANRGSATPQ